MGIVSVKFGSGMKKQNEKKMRKQKMQIKPRKLVLKKKKKTIYKISQEGGGRW